MVKKVKNCLTSFRWWVPGFVVAIVLFAACKKDDGVNVRQPSAGLMAFNLAIDKPAIGFTLSGNQFGNTPLTYAAYSGAYAPIYIGNREVRSFDYTTGSTIAISNQEFKDSSLYSVFLLGANGSYKNVVVTDDYTLIKPAAGKAWVRYINAIPDSVNTPSITVGERSENADYATVSPFKQVNVGPLNLAASNGGAINANRTISVEENKIYTILFAGQPGQTDSTKAVSIRYIQNGTATE